MSLQVHYTQTLSPADLRNKGSMKNPFTFLKHTSVVGNATCSCKRLRV